MALNVAPQFYILSTFLSREKSNPRSFRKNIIVDLDTYFKYACGKLIRVDIAWHKKLKQKRNKCCCIESPELIPQSMLHKFQSFLRSM